MKLIKTASGRALKMSKKEWESIGKTAGWMRTARGVSPKGQLGVILHHGNIVDKFEGDDIIESIGEEIGRYSNTELSKGFWSEDGPSGVSVFIYDKDSNTTYSAYPDSYSWSEYAGASPQFEYEIGWEKHEDKGINSTIKDINEMAANAVAEEAKQRYIREQGERSQYPDMSDSEYHEMLNDWANEEKDREMYDPQHGMAEEIAREVSRGPSRMGD